MYYDHTSEYSKRMQSVCIGKNTQPLYGHLCSNLFTVSEIILVLFACVAIYVPNVFIHTDKDFKKGGDVYTMIILPGAGNTG